MATKIPKIPNKSTLLSASLESADDVLDFPVKEEKEEVKPEKNASPGWKQAEMDFDKMIDFSAHRFKLYTGKRLEDMVESIRDFGILEPLILWNKDGDYILLSGYNRRNAGRLAGLKRGPVVIKKNITYEDAVLIMTETNLRQRSFSDLSESERAFCLKQHYEAMKCQGKRTDLIREIEELLQFEKSEEEFTLSETVTELQSDKAAETENQTSSKTVTRFRSDKALAEEYGLNRDKVAKYIRIARLIPPLLDRLDQKKITFQIAYDLSFIEDTIMQEILEDYLQGGHNLDKKKSELLHAYGKANRLTEPLLEEILMGNQAAAQPPAPKPIRLKPTVISRYFTPAQSKKEIEDTIEKALELYFRNEMKEKSVG